MEPEQRKGMEFEFTAFFEVDVDHKAFGSKDRTSMIDQKTFVITPDVGQSYMRWLNEGVDTVAEVLAMTEADPSVAIDSVKAEVIEMLKELGGSKNEVAVSLVKQYHPSGNPNAIKDINDMSKLRSELIDLKSQEKIGD